MSPALKRQTLEPSPPVATRVFPVGAGRPVQGNLPREQQALIERSYGPAEPHVPSLPGAAKVAILVSASAASWYALIALVRAFAG